MKHEKVKILFTFVVLSVLSLQAKVIPHVDNMQVTATSSVNNHGMKIIESTFSISANTVDKSEGFSASARFINKGDNDFHGSLGVALVDDNDNILEIIGIFGSELTLPVGYHWIEPKNTICVVSAIVPAGNYKIRVVARSGVEGWSIVYGQEESTVDILSLTVTDIVRPNKSDIIMYNGENPSFVITPDPVVQGSPIEVELGVANAGTMPFIGDIILALCKPDGDVVEEIQSLNISIPNNDEYYTFTFNSSRVNSPEGEYFLTLFQNENVSNDTTLVRDYHYYRNKMPVKILGTVSNENINKQHIFVYSQQGFVNTVSHISEIKEIKIYNLQGVEVYQSEVNDKSFQTKRTFSPGVYIVLIKTDKNIISYKVVVKK